MRKSDDIIIKILAIAFGVIISSFVVGLFITTVTSKSGLDIEIIENIHEMEGVENSNIVDFVNGTSKYGEEKTAVETIKEMTYDETVAYLTEKAGMYMEKIVEVIGEKEEGREYRKIEKIYTG